jgi:hypothetical protein
MCFPYLAIGRYLILFFALGVPAPQTPRVGGLPFPNRLGGGSPPTRSVWGAGALQGEKQSHRGSIGHKPHPCTPVGLGGGCPPTRGCGGAGAPRSKTNSLVSWPEA